MLLLASLTITAVALTSPALLGLKATVIEALWPAAIVVGSAGAFNEKAWFEIEALVTVRDAEPVFDTVIDKDLVLPVVTEPKPRTLPFRVSVPEVGCTVADLLELKPWQPTMVARQRKTRPRQLARLHLISEILR